MAPAPGLALFTSSLMGIFAQRSAQPDPCMVGSGMTNSALLNLTKSLSTEFGADKCWSMPSAGKFVSACGQATISRFP
jgi:hypothetical protein